MRHRKELKDGRYEDTTTSVLEREARVSSQDDDCGRGGIAGGPSVGITGGLVGADFGPGGCAIRLRLVPDRLLASAGRNTFGRFRGRFAGGAFWAECDCLRTRCVWRWPVVGSSATRATGKSFCCDCVLHCFARNACRIRMGRRAPPLP